MTETLEQSRARYMNAAHAMQSGVAYMADPDDASPKHTRVGINSALVNSDGLATLLIAKGIITQEEYSTAMADAMEREVQRYTEECSDKAGRPVKLG